MNSGEQSILRVRLHRISIPAFSTIGYGYGTDVETGEAIRFCGDHRPLRNLGEALRHAAQPLEVEIEHWQIL